MLGLSFIIFFPFITNGLLKLNAERLVYFLFSDASELSLLIVVINNMLFILNYSLHLI